MLLDVYCWFSAAWCTAGPLLLDVPLVLCCLMYRWSSAARCTAGPLRLDVPLVLCCLMYRWSSAAWCTSGPLLLDVLLVLCCLMYRWSSVAWCTAGSLLSCQSSTDTDYVHCALSKNLSSTHGTHGTPLNWHESASSPQSHLKQGEQVHKHTFEHNNK